MKKLITLFTLILTLAINAQTDKYDKILTATIKDFNMSLGEFELLDENGVFIKETFTPAYGKMEPKDLIDDVGTELNPKYKGKKGKIYCTKKGNGWEIQKVDFNVSTTAQKNDGANKSTTNNSTSKKEIMSVKVLNAGGGELLVDVMGENGKTTRKSFKLDLDEAGNPKLNSEASDLMAPGKYPRINEKYDKRKAKITCRVETMTAEQGGDIYWVEKIEWVPKITYANTTCNALNMGGIGYIVEKDVIYELDVNGEKKSKTWAIQNKDEICVRGTQCVKVKVDANGCVSTFNLPNVTEVTANLKIVGDKIYRTVKGGCEADMTKEYLTFKGSKIQVALIAIIYRLGMGG